MATREQKNASTLEAQAMALAEQLGRIAGTIEGTAESWLNRKALVDQLARVRDGAAEILDSLPEGTARGRQVATGSAKAMGEQLRRKAQTAAKTASSAMQTVSSIVSKRTSASKKAKGKNAKAKKGGVAAGRADAAHAPGKRIRKPSPSARGVKKSDLKIPKLRLATEVRQRRKF